MSIEGESVSSDKFSTGEGICLPLGSKLEIKKIVTATGGGGANASFTFARQGLKAAFIGVVGDDFNGHEFINTLKAEGINTDSIALHTDDHTAYSTILVHSSGERTILSYKGEGQHFNAKEVPFDSLQTSWLFLDSLGGNYDLLTRAVDWAAANKIKIATNPGSKELGHGLDKLKPLLERADIVSMNQEEAAKLTGLNYHDEEGIFKAMDELVKGIFVMTQGPDGVVVSDGQHMYRAGVPDSPVVERTGAGDAFVSGFVAQYMQSRDIVKSIQFATANSSSVVTQYGATAGILKKGEWGPWPLVEVSMK